METTVILSLCFVDAGELTTQYAYSLGRVSAPELASEVEFDARDLKTGLEGTDGWIAAIRFANDDPETYGCPEDYPASEEYKVDGDNINFELILGDLHFEWVYNKATAIITAQARTSFDISFASFLYNIKAQRRFLAMITNGWSKIA